jgi:hypothetical protein
MSVPPSIADVIGPHPHVRSVPIPEVALCLLLADRPW